MARKMFLQQPRKSNHRDHQRPVVEPVKEMSWEEKDKEWGERLARKAANRELNARPKVEYVRRDRGGRLIGSRRTGQYQPAWLIKMERRERLVWQMRHRADSCVEDTTFVEHEEKMDGAWQMECEFQKSRESEVVVSEPVEQWCYIGGFDDEDDGLEGDEAEEMGLEEESWESCGEDGDGEGSNGNGHNAYELQLAELFERGLTVRSGLVSARVKREELGWSKRQWDNRRGCWKNGHLEAHSVRIPTPAQQVFLRGEETFE